MVIVKRLLNESAFEKLHWNDFAVKLGAKIFGMGSTAFFKRIEMYGKSSTAFHVGMSGKFTATTPGRTLLLISEDRKNDLSISETDILEISYRQNGSFDEFIITQKNNLICRIVV